jgi:LPS-assembly lipoprotein
MAASNKISFVVLLALLLSACGYHLRGALQLPEALKKVYVRGASPELKEAITYTFRATAGSLVTTPREAGIILNVIHEDYQRRTISLSNTGYSNEYELLYRLTFDLQDNKGNILAAEQAINVSKTYYNNQSGNTLISKGNEENLLRKELYQQAVRSVVERARATLNKATP